MRFFVAIALAMTAAAAAQQPPQEQPDAKARRARFELARKLERMNGHQFDLPGQNLFDRNAKKPQLKNPHDQLSRDEARARSVRRAVFAMAVAVGAPAEAPFYRLSDTKPDGTPLFAARWEDVPAPTANCYQVSADAGVDTIVWKTNRAATIEVSNALLDADQRRGPWSQPRTLEVPDGWQLWANPDNQANGQRDVGVVWQVKVVKNKSSLPAIYPDGTELLMCKQQYGVGPGVSGFGTMSPASPTSQPYDYPLGPMFGSYDRYKGAATSAVITAVAPPPDAHAVTLPDRNYEVAFCWVSHKGETGLSPVQTAPRSAWTEPGVPNDAARAAARRFFIYGQPQILGALGYHLYFRDVAAAGKPAGPWVRQLARRPLGAAPAREDWIFGVDNHQPSVVLAPPAGAPTHAAVAKPQSWVSPLHLALWYTKKDVIVDVPVTIHCPLCDPYWSCWGTQTSTYTVKAKTLTIPARTTTVQLPGGGTATAQVTGSKLTLEPERVVTYEDPCKLPYNQGFGHMKFGRSISAATAKGTFKVTASTALPDGTSGPGYWPAVHVQNQKSVWEGLDLAAPLGVCSAGVTWSDWSGGQGFGTVLERCTVDVPAASPERPTQGVRVAWECVGGNGHSASELKFKDCYLGATVPVFLEHNQTADVVGERLFAANFNASRRAPCFWLDAPVTFNFRGGIYCQSSGTVFSLGWGPKVVVEDVFVDQPFVSLIDCANHQPGEVHLVHGKVNFFSPREGVPQWLARVNNSTSEFQLVLDGLTTQFSGASEVLAYHPHRNKVRLLAERAEGIYTSTTLVQADAAQWKAAQDAFWGPADRPDPPELGLSLTVPGQTVKTATDKGDKVTVAIPEQTIVFNSLTSAQKKVRQRAWATPSPLLPAAPAPVVPAPVIPSPIN